MSCSSAPTSPGKRKYANINDYKHVATWIDYKNEAKLVEFFQTFNCYQVFTTTQGKEACRRDFFRAAANGYDMIISLFLDNGVDVNVGDQDGNTALMKASTNGFDDTVAVLLQRGAVVDTLNNFGFTALMLTCHSNPNEFVSMNSVRLLLDAGAEIKDSVVINAVIGQHVTLMRELIERGVDLSRSYFFGPMMRGTGSLLICACDSGSVEMVQLLLESGIDPNMKTVEQGLTALMVAVQRTVPNLLKIIGLLLEFGADADLTNKKGKTVFEMPSKHPDAHSTIRDILLNNGYLLK